MGEITRQNSPARAMLQPTVIGVLHTKGKRCIVLLSQCSGALSSSSFCSNGVKMYHILSRPALAKHLPWRLCWTLVGVLTGPQSLTGHKPDCYLGRTEWGRGQWRQALSIPLAWEDEWHFGQISLILVSCKCFIALSLPLTGVPHAVGNTEDVDILLHKHIPEESNDSWSERKGGFLLSALPAKYANISS